MHTSHQRRTKPANLLLACGLLALLLSAANALDFVHQILPILKNNCAECHAGGKKKGGLSLNTRASLLAGGENGPIVVSGKAAESHLIHVITTDEDERMPPKGAPLTAAQANLLRQWINAGLPWDEGITLGPSAWEPPLAPRDVPLPPPSAPERDTVIDRLLDADLASRGATPPPPADDATFLRRATLDAIGLLPTPAEHTAFLADPSPDKRTRLIDRLLANDIGYADHWLTTWNDLLRNDYTGTGFITGGRKQITPWLYAALRDNKPYDQFVRELIAPTDASAGFINGIKWRGDVNASQTRDIQFAQNISQVFLGLNMKCASCHDSFIDRWTLKEAYSLAAIFAESPLELTRCDIPTGVMATPKWIFPELGDIDPTAPKKERLAQLASLMTHPDNGRFTRTVVNRIWERLMGRGIVHPVDAMDTQPWNENLLDALAAQFAADGHDLRVLIRRIMTSAAYQSQTVAPPAEDTAEPYTYAGPLPKRMTAEQFIDAIWELTGSHPAAPETSANRAITPPNEKKPETHPDIIAKWIWHSGEPGTKSQLRSGFRLEKLPTSAKLLATCDNAFVFKLNGKNVAASKDWTKPILVDITRHLKVGHNALLIDAEMFGGACGFIAQITTDADLPLTSTDANWQARRMAPDVQADWAPVKVIGPHGPKPWGPVLHKIQPVGNTPPVRAALMKNNFFTRSLGRPHRDQVVTTRPTGLTTLQAIDLANGDILADLLGKGARQLLNGPPTALADASPSDFISHLYHHGLSRAPTPAETTILNDAIGDASNLDPVTLEDLLWLVCMSPEFQIIR